MNPFQRIIFLLFLLCSSFSSWSQNSLSTFPAPNQRWLSIGDLDVGGTQITVEALYNRMANGNIQNILSKHLDPSNVNYLLRANNFQMTTSNGFKVVNSPIPVVNNSWYHIAATYDGASIKLYINGCLVADSAHTGTIVTNDFVSAIGTRSASANTDHFRGAIDEVRIWNVARTASEIMENMNDLPNPTTQNGLLAYYKFNGDYLNLQGNPAFDGVPQGTPTFDVEGPIIDYPRILDIQTTSATCFGYNDGALNISATGDQITYSIDGVNFGADSTFLNLLGGSYTAVIESVTGCRAQQTVVIDQPEQVPTPILQTNVPICQGEALVLYADSIDNAECFWIGPNGFSDSGYNIVFDVADPNIHSGEYAIFAIRNGCSSDTLRQNILVNPIYDLTIDARICDNESYQLGDQELTTPGTYNLTLSTVAGCDSIINLNLSVSPTYSFTRDTTLCEGESFTYQGQTLSVSGTYPFMLQTMEGCDSLITYLLIVYPIPEPPLLSSNSPLECPGDLVIMQANPVEGGTFAWTGPNEFSSDTTYISFEAFPENMGDYVSTVTVNGCTSPSASINLIIEKIFNFDSFEFPNVITANNDGVNDEMDLMEIFQTCQTFRFFVLDRWGNLVFEQTNDTAPFGGKDRNGNDLADGVYFYRLDYTEGVKNGFVHIIR
jgi:gliding motility-associated-like protein